MLFLSVVISWLRRFATGNKEPGYIGKVMQTAPGFTIFQEDHMIIVKYETEIDASSNWAECSVVLDKADKNATLLSAW